MKPELGLIPARARTYLEGLEPLWRSVRARLERNSLSANGHIYVDLDYATAQDLSGLLGEAVHPGRRRIDLAKLDVALRASTVAQGLVTVVAEMTGSPLVDRLARSRARRQARADLWTVWETAIVEAGLGGAPWLGAWQEDVRRTGLLSRAGDTAPRSIHEAVAVLRVLVASTPLAFHEPNSVAELLPLPPAFELAELATAAQVGAHALDHGRVTAALVLRALAAATGTPPPTTAGARRELWSLAGVTPDSVSGTLLTWGLRPPGDDPWSTMMRVRADLGLVTHITAQEWTTAAYRPWTTPGQTVFVCENPQVLQAAARVAAPNPLLCVSGNPATVAINALDNLVSTGAAVRYHGDFDVAGVRIAARLFGRGMTPWRFGADDYLAAVEHSRLPLTGTVPNTPWDPDLAQAMRSHGLAVHEEAVLNDLLVHLAEACS